MNTIAWTCRIVRNSHSRSIHSSHSRSRDVHCLNILTQRVMTQSKFSLIFLHNCLAVHYMKEERKNEDWRWASYLTGLLIISFPLLTLSCYTSPWNCFIKGTKLERDLDWELTRKGPSGINPKTKSWKRARNILHLKSRFILVFVQGFELWTWWNKSRCGWHISRWKGLACFCF